MDKKLDPMAMLTAARDNKADEIKAFVQLGMPVSISNPMGQTALHVAALWGNLEAIQTLLELKADPDCNNLRGTTPLHFAANSKQNSLEACKLLLKFGANPKIIDMTGRVAHECAEDEEVRTLLGGPDVKLFELCDGTKAEELKQFLKEKETSLRVCDSTGHTPLNLAIASEDFDTVKALVEHNKDCVTFPDPSGSMPLHVAAEMGNLDILEYILSFKPEIDYQNLNCSEYSAGNWALDGEVIMPVDKTAMHIAVEHGDVEAAEVLLKAGASPNILDFDERSPLHLAVEMRDSNMAALLLEHGADVNQANKDFTSCLHSLASSGPLSLMELVLRHNANVNTTNPAGWTPLMLAARVGKADKADKLIEAGADITAVNSQGNSALHLAAVNSHTALCSLLLEKGADKKLANKEGKIAAEMAKTPELAELLR